MNKPLYGLLGGAALFVVVALILRVSSPKPPPPKSAGDGGPVAAGYPHYDTPEELYEDFENAKKFLPEENRDIMYYLVRYHTCLSFRDGEKTACGSIDDFTTQRGYHALGRCRQMHYEGRMLKEAVEGTGSVAECELWANSDEGNMPDAPREGEENEAESCKEDMPFITKADQEGYCAIELEQTYGGPEAKRAARDHCIKNTFYFPGDSSRCEGIKEELQLNFCLEKTAFIKGVREKKPELAASTMYATLLDSKATCDGVAKLVLKQYEDRAAEYAK